MTALHDPARLALPASDPGTSGPLLRVEGLSYAYGGIPAVRDLSLVVGEGEIVALLGPNGAGKSTALRAISGMRRPGPGSVVVFAGRRVDRWPSHRIARLGMALVPEGRGLFAELSVEENLRMGGYAVDPDLLDRRIDEVCETFPILADRRHQAASTLSGGEQQQLAIARALLSAPRLLVVDEMSLGLAPLVVADLYEKVRAIHRTGTAVLLVEQQVALALSVATRAYVMERGEVVAGGRAADLRGSGALAAAYLGGGAVARVGVEEPVAVERVNVPLRPRQTRALQLRARERGVGVGDIVAEAVESYLGPDGAP